MFHVSFQGGTGIYLNERRCGAFEEEFISPCAVAVILVGSVKILLNPAEDDSVAIECYVDAPLLA